MPDVTPTIHLAHDWLVGLRGGEWVLDRLARLYGPTVLYTLVNDGRALTPAIDDCEIVTSPLQLFPRAAGAWRRWYFPIMPWAVERIRTRPCDLLISTSSAVMKSVVPPPGTPHLCYCHSPARYAWEQIGDYAYGGGGNVRAAGLQLIRKRFQRWDIRTAMRVTRFIANSRHTAAKIARSYGRDATVIHPPVRTGYFTPDAKVRREPWYLVVSALEPYKRIDLAIEAAKRLGLHLKIAGSGSQRASLERMASSCNGRGRIEFLGRVSDEAMRDLYRQARALLHPQLEDFGIIAVEAQSCGCPVAAFAAGGALETVSSETGVLFERQSADGLADAIRELERVSSEAFAAACRKNAERFGEERFDRSIEREVRSLLSESNGAGVSRPVSTTSPR